MSGKYYPLSPPFFADELEVEIDVAALTAAIMAQCRLSGLSSSSCSLPQPFSSGLFALQLPIIKAWKGEKAAETKTDEQSYPRFFHIPLNDFVLRWEVSEPELSPGGEIRLIYLHFAVEYQ